MIGSRSAFDDRDGPAGHAEAGAVAPGRDGPVGWVAGNTDADGRVTGGRRGGPRAMPS
jgi:hypothetical protein